VESLGELSCLHALGITEMQGFLFGHPLYERATTELDLPLTIRGIAAPPPRAALRLAAERAL
jgi:EAL domain-containing protein (putative c-di-GMP-specific phosphodiesterase class I)